MLVGTRVSFGAEVNRAEVTYFTMSGDEVVDSALYLEAMAESSNEPLYQFAIEDLQRGGWEYIGGYTTTNNATWNPRKPGTYRIRVKVKDRYSSLSQDSRKDLFVEIKESKASIESVEVVEGQFSGSEYTISATAVSRLPVLYEFAIEDLSRGGWIYPQPYSNVDTATWIPDRAGRYRIRVKVKNENSILNQDSRKDIFVEVSDPKSVLTVVSATNLDGYIGKMINITAEASDNSNTLFEYAIEDLTSGGWTYPQPYSANNSLAWNPTKTGKFRIRVKVKHRYSTLNQDSRKDLFIEIKEPKATLNEVVVVEGEFAGSAYEVVANGSSQSSILYEFAVEDLTRGGWTYPQSYSEMNSFNWIPQRGGSYRLRVKVKDQYSTSNQDSRKDFFIEVLEPKAVLNEMIVEEGFYIGSDYSITLNGKSDSEILYQVAIQDITTGKWSYLSSYTPNNQFKWVPLKNGLYRIRGKVKDRFSSMNQDARLDFIAEVLGHNTYTKITSNIAFIDALDLQMNSGAKPIIYSSDPNNRWRVAEKSEVEQYMNSKNYLHFEDSTEGMISSVIISTDTLNVRSNPSVVDGVVIGKVNRGAKYDVVDMVDGWYQINTSVGFGWVSGAYVSTVSKPMNVPTKISSIQVVYDNISMYSGSSKETVVASISRNTILDYLGSTGKMYYVQYAGVNGYIDVEGVKLVDTVPSSFLQFMDLSGGPNLSVASINKELLGKGILDGKGTVYKEASELYNINIAYLIAHSFLESGNGSSELANGIMVSEVDGISVEPKMVYNVFGIGAYDRDPIKLGAEYAYKQGWFSINEAIIGGTSWISKNYINHSTLNQNTLYKMRWNPINPGTHQYATDVAWAVKQTSRLRLAYDIMVANKAQIRFELTDYK